MAREVDILSLARRFSSAGFRAWAVGGFVRSRILGVPHFGEIDVATDATPQEMRRFCAVAGEIGAGFGTLLVKEGESVFECTAFRKDVGERDGRRPLSVEFTRDAALDARRRDFTMNAVYFDPLSGETFDPFSGAADLRAGRIRFVGNASDRLREDSLRALRYVRFSARYGLSQDPAERAAAAAAMPAAAALSPERLLTELERMLEAPSRAAAFRDLAELGFLAAALPELDALRRVPGGAPYHLEGDVWTHTLMVLGELDAAVARVRAVPGAALRDADLPALRWAALFHDAGKAATFSAGRDGRPHYFGHEGHSAKALAAAAARLRLPKKSAALAAWLAANHAQPHLTGEMRPAKAGPLMADPRFPALLALACADAAGRLPSGDGLAAAACGRYAEFLASGVLGRLLKGADVLAKWPYLRGPQVGAKLAEENLRVLGEYRRGR